MSSEYKGELDIKAIIGAPLIAASKANSLMQNEQVRYLLDTCFFADETNPNVLSPVMVKMVLLHSFIDYSASNEERAILTHTKTEFQVPLISLIPINPLSVDDFELDFSVEITSMNQNQSQRTDMNEAGALLKGKIAKKHYSKDTSLHSKGESRDLSVKIHANSTPVPQGIKEIIDIYTRSIHPTQNDTNKLK